MSLLGQLPVEDQRRAVLVADDEGPILDLVGRVITRLGLVALKASDGAAALELATKHRDILRCAILDIQMPILNGAEVAHTLRKSSPELAIVLMSGGVPPSLLDRISQLRVSCVLHKPFSLQVLREVLIQAAGIAPLPVCAPSQHSIVGRNMLDTKDTPLYQDSAATIVESPPNSDIATHSQPINIDTSPAEQRWASEGGQDPDPQDPGSDIVPAAEPSHQLATRQVSTTWVVDRQAYERFEVIFRSYHTENAALHRGPYEHYRVVYRYGYELGADMRYAQARWVDVERDAKPRWEERNPGTWVEFQALIQYAWNTSRIWQSDSSAA